MIIRVSELPREGLTVEDVSQFASAFGDRSWQLEAVTLALEPDGSDVLVQGEIQATAPQECGRCLETFSARIAARVDLRMSPRPAGADSIELGADDLDMDFYVDDQLDLTALVLNETTLALPMKPLCREECRGLCPMCGGNRNLVACECRERQPDPRLVALGTLSARLGR
jgi:DUF177 domain-containing protein